MEQINIAELLKDCPKGMELYSPLCGECKFFNIVNDVIYVESPLNKTLCFNSLGMFFEWYEESECLLFPSKDQRDWSTFRKPFKDGDILTSGSDGCKGNPFIFKQINSFGNAECYCAINCFGELIFNSDNWTYIKCCKFATPKEKEKLFDVIREKGYKWNPENKTLEKLTEFKDGDVAISDLGDIHLLRTKDSSYCAYRIRWTGLSKLDTTLTTSVKVVRLATEAERQILFDSIKANGYKWNEDTKSLEKLINKNKFVIGAIVTNGKIKGKICLRDGDSYVLEDGTYIFFNEVHNWELAPNKFDSTTLKPFDKVLVRHNKDNKWRGSFFSHIDGNLNYHCYKYVTIGGKSYPMCIPHEGNEHLCGTTDDCDEYFETW